MPGTLFSKTGSNNFSLPQSSELLADELLGRSTSHENPRAVVTLGALYFGDVLCDTPAVSSEKLLSVLAAVASDEKSSAFRFPFDVSALTDYCKVVPNQLDLSLIGSKVLAGVYHQEHASNAALCCAFQDDLFDTFFNCCAFHQVGHNLCADAVAVAQRAATVLSQHGIPLYYPFVALQTDEEDESGEDGADNLLLQALLLTSIRLLREKDSSGVLYRIEPLFEGLPKSIEELSQQVVAGGFRCFAEFHRTVDVMLCSAIASGIVSRRSAIALRNEVRQLWTEEAILVIQRSFLSATVEVSGDFRTISSCLQRDDPWLEAQGTLMDEGTRQSLLSLVMSLQARDTQLLFTYPVMSPSYLGVVANPIDFTTMKLKIVKGIYRAATEVLQDVELMYDNSLSFNGPASEVTKSFAAIRSSLPDLLQELGISS